MELKSSMTRDMSNMISHHSQALAREKAGSRLLPGCFMSKPRVSLEYAYSMPRVCLEYAKSMARVCLGVSQSGVSGLPVRSKRTPSPEQADSHSEVGGLRALRYAVFLMLVMIGVNLWGQTTITDLAGLNGMTANGNYIITADIDATNYTPTLTEAFTGKLTAQAKADGTYPVISGISKPLFTSVTDNATISNIMFKDITVSGSGSVGAICGTANGSTRIYNCGVLPKYPQFNDDTHTETSTVSSSDGYCGSLVGQLSGNARVINCFSYATITGGSTVAGIVGYIGNTSINQGNLTTVPMVVNCMFYGDITSGSTKYPVYGGAMIKNNATNGINPYNYFLKNATFDNSYTSIDSYNRSWPAEEKNLTRFEYYRSILNSNKHLCTYWVTDKAYSDQTAVDTALIAKWVLDETIAPYPILKKWGKYYSVINRDTQYRINPDTKTNESRSNAKEWEGKTLGTLKITINPGSHAEGDASTKTDVPFVITDMDILNCDYGYYKVQLPYYNDQFGNPSVEIPATTADDFMTKWNQRYGGNYKEYVVTGWEISNVVSSSNFSGTRNPFNPNWENGYNFADRNCIDKDLYSGTNVGGRIFAQGGYYYVPKDVESITITAHWGKAVYLANRGKSVDRVNVTNASYKADSPFALAGTLPDVFKPAVTTNNAGTIYSDLQDAIKALQVKSDTYPTIYDQAIVLVGNHQVKNGSEGVGYSLDNKWHPFTFMSADFDIDNEPDFCLQLQFRKGTDRPGIQPVRFDFLPVVELGLAVRHDKKAYAIGVFIPQGHFEITETSFMRTTQFEWDCGQEGGVSRIANDVPVILNGGEFDQLAVRYVSNSYVSGGRTGYFLLGGNLWFHRFAPGAHPHKSNTAQIRLCAVNAIGGDFPEFYLSGLYKPGLTPRNDQGNPHCYIDGGNFGSIHGAGYDKIMGSITFKVNHSLIGDFYGGGINGSNPVGGDIDITIDNSRVTKYCGGPEVGDMTGKTITTNATGTTFGVFYGGGNGGNSYFRELQFDGDQNSSHIGTWTDNTYNWNAFKPLKDTYDDNVEKENKGYHAEYEFEVFNQSNGVEDKITQRGFIKWIQFGKTITGDVENTLTSCTVENNFYGGGNLATVDGTVTSTLINTIVRGNVFGGGYSAAIPTFQVHDKDNKSFPSMDFAGTITDGYIPYDSRVYEWTNDLNGETIANRKKTPTYSKTINGQTKWYCYTWNSLEDLGVVKNDITLKITTSGTNGISTIGTVNDADTGYVYGGGDASAVTGNTSVTLAGNTQVLGNVFGGGNSGEVSGSATVNIQETAPSTNNNNP